MYAFNEMVKSLKRLIFLVFLLLCVMASWMMRKPVVFMLAVYNLWNISLSVLLVEGERNGSSKTS